jgi:hypothetical protein
MLYLNNIVKKTTENCELRFKIKKHGRWGISRFNSIKHYRMCIESDFKQFST